MPHRQECYRGTRISPNIVLTDFIHINLLDYIPLNFLIVLTLATPLNTKQEMVRLHVLLARAQYKYKRTLSLFYHQRTTQHRLQLPKHHHHVRYSHSAAACRYCGDAQLTKLNEKHPKNHRPTLVIEIIFFFI